MQSLASESRGSTVADCLMLAFTFVQRCRLALIFMDMQRAPPVGMTWVTDHALGGEDTRAIIARIALMSPGVCDSPLSDA